MGESKGFISIEHAMKRCPDLEIEITRIVKKSPVGKVNVPNVCELFEDKNGNEYVIFMGEEYYLKKNLSQ